MSAAMKFSVKDFFNMMYKKKDYFINNLIISIYLSFTLFFFLPTILYFNNQLDFPFSYSDIFLLLIITSAIAFTFIFITLWLIPPRLISTILILLIIIGILVWIQSTLFVWDYGSFNGAPKVWENFTIFGLLELIIYLSIIFVCYFRRKELIKNIPILFIALLITQIIVIFPFFINPPSEPIYKGYFFSDEKQFQFSSQQNVIIVIFDTFQSDAFNEIIFDNRTSLSDFDGFIYYRNAVGNYPFTRAAVPALLSGEYYLNEQPFKDYLQDKAYPKYISKLLKNEGYYAGFYDSETLTFLPLYPHPEIASNVERIESFDKTIFPLYALVAFRVSPHFGKIFIYDHVFFSPDAFLNKNSIIQFNNNLIHNATFTNTTKIFKLYHLETPHPPYQLNESLQLTELPNTREGYITQSTGSLIILKDLVFQLKQSNAYNQSMIIVIGDHGAGLSSNQTISGKKADIEKINAKMGAGIPLILIKPFDKTGPLKISETPVSLSDIPITIIDEIGLKNNTYSGVTMLSNPSSDNRTRRYYEYEWYPNLFSTEFFPPIKEYLITGHSWDYQSWRTSGSIYTKKGVNYINNSYSFGTPLLFSNRGSSGNFTIFGWSNPEPDFTWTAGNFASIGFTLDNVSSDVILDVDGFPFLGNGNVSSQPVSVYVNNYYLTEWVFRGIERKVSVIPKEYFDNKKQTSISFIIPKATSPSTIQISEDPRILGIAVKTLRISQFNNYPQGKTILFAKNGSGQQYIISGFSEPEESFTWTDGHESILGFQMSNASQDLKLTIKATPFLGNGSMRNQPVYVSINNHPIADWKFTRQEQLETRIPFEVIRESPNFMITFEMPNAESPRAAGISKDSRLLGIAIEEIQIS